MLLSLKRLGRWHLLFLLPGVLLTLYLLYFLQQNDFLPSVADLEFSSPQTLLSRQQTLWRSLYPQLLQAQPQCDAIQQDTKSDLSIGFNASDDSHVRPDILELSDSQLTELRSSHQKFLMLLKASKLSLPFIKNTRGVVTTAAGSDLPVVLLSIRMLRVTGCQLPVEVFLASREEWDAQMCGEIFPSMSAQCVVLDHIFAPEGVDISPQLHRYQFKIMSIIFSSFEDVLFIDADCFPIFDPTSHFESWPFRSSGMIRWPDFWFPSESKAFFDIVGIEMPEIQSRAATESGELLYSKKMHAESLLLAVYYNFYGPEYYYALMSQGAPGEGDKETFLWSAVVMEEPIYSVQQGVRALGYIAADGSWRGSAMVQFDAVDDFNARLEPNVTTVRPMFVHANLPKLDPGSIFLEKSYGRSNPTTDTDGTPRRIWHDDENATVKFFGFDLERRLWENVRDLVCKYEGVVSAWDGEAELCEKATAYWNAVFEPPQTTSAP